MRRTLCFLAVIVASAALGAQPARSPRAAERQLDLQGVWNFSTITPLERPAEFAGREFMTDAEAAAFEQRVAQQSNRDNRSGNRDADVASAYNEFWWDHGSHVARVNGKPRTSLIVSPADGKIPALTPAGQARATE